MGANGGRRDNRVNFESCRRSRLTARVACVAPPRSGVWFARLGSTPSQLVLPVFVRSGAERQHPVASMPGVAQTSIDEMLRDASAAAEAGVGGFMLFGIPDRKDSIGSEAWDEQGAVQQGVRALKREFPELVVITDVCLCEYTDHGHCGVFCARDSVDNDATLELLAQVAVSYAAAGVDVVAPSDMMDGRVAAIRTALDATGSPRRRS